MIANLTILAIAVGSIFGFFMLGLAYAQLSTHGIDVHRAEKH